MPSRILREGILSSEGVCSLDWEAEVFYRRLMSVADDYGRFPAHPALLRAALYPLQLDKTRESNMERLLACVEQARLVRLYEVEGKKYLEILKFRQQHRTKSKYPEPLISDCEADAKQLISKCEANEKRLRTYAYSNAYSDSKAQAAARAAPAAPSPNGKNGRHADPPPMDVPPSEEKKVASRRPPSGDFHALVEHFRQRWEERYAGVQFVFSEKGDGGKNGEAFKWTLEQCKGDLERAKATVDAYLADGSQRLIEERHPVPWIKSGFNKYQAPSAVQRKSRVLEKVQTFNQL